MALLAGSMRVPRPATGMTALVTFGMWVPWCLLDARFAGFCGSGPCPRIGPAGAAYAVLMCIGPPLAGIRGHGPLLHCGLHPLMRGSAYRHGWRKFRFCRSTNRLCAPVQGEVSHCEPPWPACQFNPCLPKPIKHTRPRGGPCPYPLVWSHPNDAIGFGNLRAVTNGPGKTSGARGLLHASKL